MSKEERHEDQPSGTEWMADLARLVNAPGYERWRSMVAAAGGCAHPVHLAGQSMIVDTGTGEILHVYTTDGEPSGHLLVACGNRRASVCPACSQTYQADTFHLIRAGLSGGKGVPETVSAHPRAFVTLTAPSFGPSTRTATAAPVVPATAPGGASTGGRSAATSDTSPRTNGSASRSAPTATTTRARCCGRHTRARCGTASPWPSARSWPTRPG